MAKWCDEGENWLLDVAFKKNTSPPTNLYLGLIYQLHGACGDRHISPA